MATSRMFEPEDSKPTSPAAGGVAEGRVSSSGGLGKLDLSELTAAFNAHGGGRVTPELSADLALEIVLNEIVEQACITTGASGAAIALERGGEWICRACAGDNSPQLGTRLDTETGLSGACLKTRQLQRCDDTQSDPRVDIEACRELGVRSVIVLPLLQDGELAGVFELFSGERSAFGERDQRTLEALSQRVLATLKQTAEPVGPAPATSPNLAESSTFVEAESAAKSEEGFAANSLAETGKESKEKGSKEKEPETRLFASVLPPPRTHISTGRGTQFLTWILGAAVLASAVFLTVVVAQRVRAGRAAGRASASGQSRVLGARDPGTATTGANATPSAPIPGNAPNSSSAGSTPGSSATKVSGSNQSLAPAGSLLVYENGREIFRMPPTAEAGDPVNAATTNARDAGNPSGNAEQRASAVERATSDEPAAQSNLLYRVEPDYPETARLQKIQGSVVLEVTTRRDGAVQEVKLVSGEPLLAEAAIAAVKQWRFKPRVVQGQASPMQTRVVLNFRLPQ